MSPYDMGRARSIKYMLSLLRAAGTAAAPPAGSGSAAAPVRESAGACVRVPNLPWWSRLQRAVSLLLPVLPVEPVLLLLLLPLLLHLRVCLLRAVTGSKETPAARR